MSGRRRISEFDGLTVSDLDMKNRKSTFCNMAKSGTNPRTLQYHMDHSDIDVTLNTYTHISFDDAQKALN